MIDPGYEPKKIADYVKAQGLPAKGIILTHHHHDHVGGAAKVAEALDCPIMMSFEDSLKYRRGADILLKDGDVLDLDGEELKIFLTPGHTHGSLCILSAKSKVVFTGDTVFDTDLGRTDLEDGSPAEMRASCRNVVNLWPDDYRIYPGHDESATMKQVREYNREFLECLK